MRILQLRWRNVRHQIVAVHVAKNSPCSPRDQFIAKTPVTNARAADRIKRHIPIGSVLLKPPKSQGGERAAQAVAREVDLAFWMLLAVAIQQLLCVCPDYVESIRETF